MSSSRSWLRQAKSDLYAADRLWQDDAQELYCQVTAKCQQVVEKSIKAIAAELSERGSVALTIGFDHRIDQYVTAIIRAPVAQKKSVPDYIRQTLRRTQSELKEIMSLAPHKPLDITQLPRNTEYPFHNAQGVLIAPSDVDIFQRNNVARYLRLAGIICEKAQVLITIAELEPRS